MSAPHGRLMCVNESILHIIPLTDCPPESPCRSLLHGRGAPSHVEGAAAAFLRSASSFGDTNVNLFTLNNRENLHEYLA